MTPEQTVLMRVLELIRCGHPMPFSVRQDNPLAGKSGRFTFVFEGEDDLLHLTVSGDPAPTTTEAQRLLDRLMPGVPPALIWIKPGNDAVHFYIGHDVLLEHVQLESA